MGMFSPDENGWTLNPNYVEPSMGRDNGYGHVTSLEIKELADFIHSDDFAEEMYRKILEIADSSFAIYEQRGIFKKYEFEKECYSAAVKFIRKKHLEEEFNEYMSEMIK